MDLAWLFGIDNRVFTFTPLNVDVYDINLNDVLIGHLRKTTEDWEYYSVIPISFNNMQKLVTEIEFFLEDK